MKKNIEWLKREIHKELESWYGVEGGIDGDGINEIMLLINQLDEPEVLSDKWIDEHAFGDWNEYVYAGDLKEVIVPKQELPVIPKIVADWVESRDYYNVYKVLQDLSAPGSPHASKDVRNWIFRNQENVEKFVRAWLDGYEVEEEQKYILSINITDKASKTNYETFLNKRGIFHSMENESFNSEEFNWTEEEIKNLESGEILFEHFATRVEEPEE